MTDSLRKRYAFKFSTNLVGLAANVVIQALVPRGLGLRAYGDFNFLSNFFAQVVGFFDMGTSDAFYTKLSHRPDEKALVTFYLYFLGAASLLILASVGLAMKCGFGGRLWPHQQTGFILMAAIWAILMWVVQVLTKIADAYGLTTVSEKARIGQRLVGLGLILLLFVTDRLSLGNFFAYHYLIILLLSAALVRIVAKRRMAFVSGWRLLRHQWMGYGKEFWRYCHPLFVYSLFGLFSGVLDRWLLQVFYGSEEQGLFGLSYQIGAICFLFTSAMTPLLLRDFSVAFAQRNLDEMGRLFRRYIPFLYSVAAYFSCFIAVQAERVIELIGGKSYAGALTAVMIMALYPVHQTYGQLSGSLFFATGQTSLYRNIGVFFMIIGLPLTYFLLAPTERYGLGAGATGLAVKMVVLQFAWVNAQLYFNCRLLTIGFRRLLAHQLIAVATLLSTAFLATRLTGMLLDTARPGWIHLLAAGIGYSLFALVLAIVQPRIFGLQKDDVQRLWDTVQRRVKRIFEHGG